MGKFKALLVVLLALGSYANAQSVDPRAAGQQCKGKVYLTLDTGNMRHAELIAGILSKHQVKATFFLANEPVFPDRKRYALDDSFADYWRARLAEGHAFGSHTWRHGVLLADKKKSVQETYSMVSYRPQFGEQAGKLVDLDKRGLCEELDRVNLRFQEMTGKRLDALWRAPGGRTTAFSLEAAKSCGYQHVHWASAGFLGDELSSETHPNEALLSKALASIRDGDILMGHLGIWSRKVPFAPMFEPLIAGLKSRGFCFSSMNEHPMMRKS